MDPCALQSNGTAHFQQTAKHKSHLGICRDHNIWEALNSLPHSWAWLLALLWLDVALKWDLWLDAGGCLMRNLLQLKPI